VQRMRQLLLRDHPWVGINNEFVARLQCITTARSVVLRCARVPSHRVAGTGVNTSITTAFASLLECTASSNSAPAGQGAALLDRRTRSCRGRQQSGVLMLPFRQACHDRN
jgi:hypothetical protein